VARLRLIALLLPMLLPAVAVAAPSAADLAAAEALATEAKLYFRTKQFEKAAELFMKAYVKGRTASLVYNAARAYEEGGKIKQAIATFEHYQTLAKDDPAGRKAAAGRIAALRKIERRQAEAERRRAAAAAAKAAAAKARAAAAAKARAAAAAAKAKANRKGQVAGKAPAGGGAHGKLAPARPFPVWRTVGAGTLLAVSVAAYANAWTLANDIQPEDITDDDKKNEYLANQDSATSWRVVSVGAAVVGVGVGAWAFWDWWQGRKAGKGTSAAASTSPRVLLLPSRDGVTMGAALTF